MRICVYNPYTQLNTKQFFPTFDSGSCASGGDVCKYHQVSDQSMDGILNNGITVIDIGCTHNYIMYSLNTNSTESFEYELSDLESINESQISRMYVSGMSVQDPMSCWSQINDEDNEIMNGYVYIDDDMIWSQSLWLFFCVSGYAMASCFVCFEWLFYSFNEIMIPRKDYRAYISWSFVRIGWMSFMFSIVIAHSLVIKEDVSYMIGSFAFSWIAANCYIATLFSSIALVIGCCLVFCNENQCLWEGCFDRGSYSNASEYGFERCFLPQSRMDMQVISDFEHMFAVVMLVITVFFVIPFIICGFVPFIEFLNGGLSGYTHFPYIASLWFLCVVGITFQMCWFVRARCCGDEDDKRKAANHDQQVQVQRAASSQNIR